MSLLALFIYGTSQISKIITLDYSGCNLIFFSYQITQTFFSNQFKTSINDSHTIAGKEQEKAFSLEKNLRIKDELLFDTSFYRSLEYILRLGSGEF